MTRRVDTENNPKLTVRPTVRPPPAAVQIDELRRRIIGLAVKLVWNKADAEELAQETLRIALTKKIDLHDDGASAWCLRTVANLCMNQRRRQRPEPLGDWVGEHGGTTPVKQAETTERLERLRDCVAQLPPQQRLALTMRWMEQQSYADVAQVMELSESAVRAHVHQARRTLGTLMKDDE